MPLELRQAPIWEQNAAIPVTQISEETSDRIHERIVEQNAEFPVPQILEEITEQTPSGSTTTLSEAARTTRVFGLYPSLRAAGTSHKCHACVTQATHTRCVLGT